MEVILPGGLPNKGRIERHAQFRPITGRIEQRLIELSPNLEPTEYVSEVLGASLARIGNVEANAENVSNLCVADRQYLMLRLVAMLAGEQMWLKLGCCHCDALFDVETKRCDLPVKEAGDTYPFVTIQLNSETVKARIPTGTDQKCIGDLSEEDAIQELLHRCVQSVNGKKPAEEFFASLSEADITQIDDALDDAAPAICNQLLVNCPECGHEQYTELDHYSIAGISKNLFYSEVHRLASQYHWSEEDILELPQTRRHLYLDMINYSTGMVS